jgi:DNA-binding response OmpR family regulator
MRHRLNYGYINYPKGQILLEFTPARSRRTGSQVRKASAMANGRLLLVEDEPDLCALLALSLRRAGYTVDIASTAAEAQELMQAQSYAMVIVDWVLPDGNGIDLADDALQRDARTLIISGYAFGLPAGAAQRHEILMKPVSTDDLVAAVQRRIGKA